MLDSGANINAEDRHKDTALHKASSNGRYEASRNGRYEAVKLLLDSGANINARNALEIDDDLIGILWRWSAIYAAALGIGLRGDIF